MVFIRGAVALRRIFFVFRWSNEWKPVGTIWSCYIHCDLKDEEKLRCAVVFSWVWVRKPVLSCWFFLFISLLLSSPFLTNLSPLVLIFFFCISSHSSSAPLSLSHPAGLIISLQLLRGDMEQVRRENPLIFSRGVAITRKLGFPDVIMPGESHLQPPSWQWWSECLNLHLDTLRWHLLCKDKLKW